jgi:hypothetical protein
MKIQVLKPTDGDPVKNGVTVFLAGSIEMGVAEDWQTKIANFDKTYFKTENQF